MIYTGIVDVFNGECGSFIPVDGIRVCFRKSDANFEIIEGKKYKFDCDQFGITKTNNSEIVWVKKIGDF